MSASNVLPFPAAPVVFDFQSERLLEAIRLLQEHGFKVSNTGAINRFRIEDKDNEHATKGR
jgi:hypothetical protein